MLACLLVEANAFSLMFILRVVICQIYMMTIAMTDSCVKCCLINDKLFLLDSKTAVPFFLLRKSYPAL